MSFREPKSWSELLKQRESERNQPPPKEYYVLQKQVVHPDGGVISIQAPDARPIEESLNNNLDTRLYTGRDIFNPDEEEENTKSKLPRIVKPSHDHGLDITSWKLKTKIQREIDDRKAFETRPKNYPKAQMESEDYDIVTGIPHQTPYKATINNLLRQRERSKYVERNREFDPISNTYPSECLELKRATSELQQRQRELDYHFSKMSANEKRANKTLVNIITGEIKDENASKAINEFPTSDIRRCVKSKRLEAEIVERRENEVRARTAKVGCRYNNGRMKELRDWNIINGKEMKVGWDESVKMKPSIWTWCQSERLDV
ncbi:hypothetical protein TRFO_41970 [Tritrichomonas foetus]|uniref:Uncharacterized protein n=1 Tax=Tritrichomonas foetus TaxID=1144522 RepID=A0A1J4L2V4_9EUKA|nr:hypothetical protein TRFO_41970 [Tritrichomonas foetus]|eukprot:OHT16229.1 hypothetical protein TRFO_41970 [Tritrichomonas foetus]